jgi:hypothetical protein
MNAMTGDERAMHAASLIRMALDVLCVQNDSPEFASAATRFQSDAPTRHARLAELLYRERGERFEVLKPELVGEPAWDILLDLFVQQSKGKRVSVTSACIASRAPPTTALRWITSLIENGMLVRTEDSGDRRRAYLELSQSSYAKLGNYLENVDQNRIFA